MACCSDHEEVKAERKKHFHPEREKSRLQDCPNDVNLDWSKLTLSSRHFLSPLLNYKPTRNINGESASRNSPKSEYSPLFTLPPSFGPTQECSSSLLLLQCHICVAVTQLWDPFQPVIDEQCVKLNRWHRGTPRSIILSHGFTFHHLVNSHTHIKHTHAHQKHIIAAAGKGRHLRTMITATDCCSVNTDLYRHIRGLNIAPACWEDKQNRESEAKSKDEAVGKKCQPSLKWIMPLYRITTCLTRCISVKERRLSLYKYVFSSTLFFSSTTSRNVQVRNIKS